MEPLLRDTPKLRYAVIVLSLAPIVTVALYIYVLGLNVPYWDQWEVVPLLVKAQTGTLQFGDLMAQHTMHRPVVPRLLWLALARLTHYNTNAELWLNFVLALATLWIFLSYSWRFWREQAVPQLLVYMLTPVLCLLIFNLVQWESWLIGFQTVMYLAVLCVMAGFALLAGATGTLTWGRLLGALLLGVIATYSSSNALLYWPIGLALVVLNGARAQRIVYGAVWVGVAALVIASFAYGLGGQAGGLLTQSLGLTPLFFVHWILNFLGAPLLAYAPAWILGALSVALIALAIAGAWSARLLLRTAFYWAVITFVLGSAGLIMLARSYGGVAFALAPRYITQSTWYWAAILALFPIMRISPKLRMGLLGVVVVLLTLSMGGGAISGYKWHYLRAWPVYHAVRSGEPVPDEALFNLYDDVPPAVVRERLDLLCEYQWSVCATGK